MSSTPAERCTRCGHTAPPVHQKIQSSPSTADQLLFGLVEGLCALIFCLSLVRVWYWAGIVALAGGLVVGAWALVRHSSSPSVIRVCAKCGGRLKRGRTTP